MDTQQALGNAGAPFEIDYDGRGKPEKVKILYRVQRIKAKFERWAKDRAISEIIKLKTILPVDEYRSTMQSKLNEFESDDYAYDSERLKALRDTDAGKLAHVRTMIDGGELWSDEDLENLLLDKGDEIIAYTSACSARVEQLLKDLGDEPDPKEAARRLKKAGWWA